MAACPIVIFTKIIGTVALGTLTGSFISLNFAVIPIVFPAIKCLISKSCNSNSISCDIDIKSRSNLFLQIVNKFQSLTTFLSTIASISLLSAFKFSSSKGRHPYLIYASLIGPIIYTLNNYVLSDINKEIFNKTKTLKIQSSKSSSNLDIPSSLGDSHYTDLGVENSNNNNNNNNNNTIDSSNIDNIIISVKQWRKYNALAGFVTSSLAFFIATVGIYGDLA